MSNRNFFISGMLITLMIGLGGCFGARSSIDVTKLNQYENIVPVAVIGSGPAGMLAADYGQRGGMYTVVFEGDLPGGLLTQTSLVENWPGEVSIFGPEIMKKLKNQAEHLGVQFVTDTITAVNFSQWPYALQTLDGKTIYALSVIIATGAAPRRLKIPGEDQYWGTGVTSCAVCDAPFYKDEEVVVVGGGDSAVEEAIQLTPYAKKITILVRKDAMRAAVRMQEHLKSYDKISVKYNMQIKSIIGDDTKVTHIEIEDTKTGKTSKMPISGVFLAIGHIPNTKLFGNQITTDADGYVSMVKGRSQATSVQGVFAAGDVEDREYRQAGVAAGSGIKAGLDAINFLNDIGYTPQIMKEIESNLYKVDQKRSTANPVEKITSVDHLNEIKKIEGLSIIDFYADYCPSCLQMLPIFEEVAQKFKGKARFAKVNIEETEDIAREVFVQTVPCILVFRNGTLIARYNEAMNKKELTKFVQQFLDSEVD